jgi:hypothetical protein
MKNFKIKRKLILTFIGTLLLYFIYVEHKSFINTPKYKTLYETELVIGVEDIDINNIINIIVTFTLTLTSVVGTTIYWLHDRLDKAEKSLILLSTVTSDIEKDLKDTKEDLKANSADLALNVKEINQTLSIIREGLIKDSLELENLKDSLNYIKASLVKNS